MFIFKLLLPCLIHWSAHGGEVVRFPKYKVAPTTKTIACEKILYDFQPQKLSPRVKNVSVSLMSIAKGRSKPSDWETEDLESDLFYRQSTASLPGLKPTPQNSVVLHSTRSGLFIVVQIVKDQELMDIVDVIEMMRRFGDPLVDTNNVGLEIWVGRHTGKAEVLGEALHETEWPLLTRMLSELQQSLVKSGVVSRDEVIGEFKDHVLGNQGKFPAIYWSSLRLVMKPRQLTLNRMSHMVQELENISQEKLGAQISESL